VHLFYWFGAARFLIKHPTDIFLYSDNNAVMYLDSAFSLEPITETAALTSHNVDEVGNG